MLYEISIRPALNGFIIKAGCQTIVFETVDKLVDNLRDYLRNPEVHEKTFMASAINRKHTHPDPPAWPVPAYPTSIHFGMPVTTSEFPTVSGGTTGTSAVQTICGTQPVTQCRDGEPVKAGY